MAKSTTKRAKGMIRNEALTAFSIDLGYDEAYGRTRLDRMQHQAENTYPFERGTNYQKGKQLVDDGFFRVYYRDQAEFLKKIYGKKVEGWSGKKIHATYSHLIAREYDAMIREKKTKKTAPKKTSSVKPKKKK